MLLENSSSLVFRSKRLAVLRGVFVLGGRCWRSFVGWEPSALYVIDNQKRTIPLVPNLIICKGVGNQTPCNRLIINHLRILACQTCVYRPEKTCRRNGLAGKAARRKSLHRALHRLRRTDSPGRDRNRSYTRCR